MWLAGSTGVERADQYLVNTWYIDVPTTIIDHKYDWYLVAIMIEIVRVHH